MTFCASSGVPCSSRTQERYRASLSLRVAVSFGRHRGRHRGPWRADRQADRPLGDTQAAKEAKGVLWRPHLGEDEPQGGGPIGAGLPWFVARRRPASERRGGSI